MDVYYIYDPDSKRFLYPTKAKTQPQNSTTIEPVNNDGSAMFEPITWDGSKWIGLTYEEWEAKQVPTKPKINSEKIMQASTLKELAQLKVSLSKIEQQQAFTTKLTAQLMLDQAKNKAQGDGK